ncbi:MAG: hypothetical protein ACLUE8_11895 [Lachnospiraceae bacterium]
MQATESNHFLRFQFNWCNNRGGNGLVDPYFFFYIKNVGFPYLLILLALLKRKPKHPQAPRRGGRSGGGTPVPAHRLRRVPDLRHCGVHYLSAQRIRQQ